MKRAGLILTVVVLFCASLNAQIKIRELPRDLVQARLRKFAVKNAERQAALKALFADAGCGGERLTEQAVKNEFLGNVICTLPGATDSVIIVGAHFDAVDAGYGVADNWSGASLLPSLYESLAERPRRHTFVFVGFSSEEQGLVGSEYYAKHIAKDQRARTHAMINLDTLGLDSTQVWISHSDAKLVKMMAAVARAMKLPVGATNFEKVGGTDSEPFERIKIPSLAVHSVTPRNFQILHSPQDSLKAINLDEYYSTYRLLAVFLGYLDTALTQKPAEEEKP